MLLFFLFLYNFVKKFVSHALLISIYLYGCNNVNNEHKMELSFGSEEGGVNRPENNRNSRLKGNGCKYLACGVVGALVGAGIATAIEVPVYNGSVEFYKINSCFFSFQCMEKAA